MESESSKTSNKKDPGWKYNHKEDPMKKESRVICNFCGFPSSGGIYRAKLHQMGGFPDVRSCEKVPLEVKEELWALYRQKHELNVRKKQNEPDVNIIDDADDVEVEQAKQNSRGKRASVAILGSSKAKKAKKTKDLKDLDLQKPGETTIQLNNHQEKWETTNEDENTYDAAGSSGLPTAQSFPHNEEGKTEEEQEFNEEFKLLSECYPDMIGVEAKWLEDQCKRESTRKWQERLKKFFEEEGITKKFKAFCLKCKEEDERQYKEVYKQLCEEFEEDIYSVTPDDLKIFPEIPTEIFSGSSNVSSNWEKELQ